MRDSFFEFEREQVVFSYAIKPRCRPNSTIFFFFIVASIVYAVNTVTFEQVDTTSFGLKSDIHKTLEQTTKFDRKQACKSAEYSDSCTVDTLDYKCADERKVDELRGGIGAI